MILLDNAPKNSCFVGGGLCNFQLSCRGGSLSFVPSKRGGSCVFQPSHFKMLWATSPFSFWSVSSHRGWREGGREGKEGLPGVFHPSQIGCILLVSSETTRYMSDYGANYMTSGNQLKVNVQVCCTVKSPKQNVEVFFLTKKLRTILANLFCPHCVVHWQALSCPRAWTTDLLTTKTRTTIKKIWVLTNFSLHTLSSSSVQRTCRTRRNLA